jgi:hypothetical protein
MQVEGNSGVGNEPLAGLADHDVGCVTKNSLRLAKSSDLIEVMARQTRISG